MLKIDLVASYGIGSLFLGVILTIFAGGDTTVAGVSFVSAGVFLTAFALCWRAVPSYNVNIFKRDDLYEDLKRHLTNSPELNNAVSLANALSTDDFLRLVRVMCEARHEGIDEAMKLATELYRREKK